MVYALRPPDLGCDRSPLEQFYFADWGRHQGNLADSPILAVSDHDAEVARVTIVTSQIGRNFPGRCECSLLIRKVFTEGVTYRVAVL